MNNNNNNATPQKSFEEAKQAYFDSLSSYHYVFAMTKCCNHYEWITIMKTFTCRDLYKQIKAYYDCPGLKIYVNDSYGNKLEINECDLELKTLLQGNGTFFRPIYSLPSPVVYKLCIDYGPTRCC